VIDRRDAAVAVLMVAAMIPLYGILALVFSALGEPAEIPLPAAAVATPVSAEPTPTMVPFVVIGTPVEWKWLNPGVGCIPELVLISHEIKVCDPMIHSQKGQ
jgi:hypothetical protein